jgi:hypothetical protein
METLTPIERAVLDTAVRGAGNLERFYQRLHAPPMAVPLADIASAAWSLIRRGLLGTDAVDARDPSLVWMSQIHVTPAGREILATSTPRGNAWPRGRRVSLGMFKGMIPNFPLELYKQNRREMAGRHPEGFGL